MTGRGRKVGAAIIALTMITGPLADLDKAGAKIVVPESSVIEVDGATVKSVVAMFERAEQAVKAHDLDTVMAAYSPQYNYHGLKKDDVRKVWMDLFDEYQDIASTHLLTKFTKVGSGNQALLEVTCTGHLWARSKTSGLFVPIDSWHEEVHYLVLEGGEWRIRGNLGEAQRVLPFGTSPHPLF
ncbi:MAG: hypothetical protein FJ247_00685 [Nitrospira sp.]|nr:hypothetical protein [Nitrospira sp.]